MKDHTDTVTAELPVTDAPETSRPEGLTLVQMYQINVKPQVRTETGWSASELAELGDSIMSEGLLQLPLLRRDPESNTLIPVAGHRRIEAMKRKGFTEFYAIVGDADEAKAFRMQLAENIQREQLSTKETANAVRRLADEGNTPGEIAEIVKKSKAWVSKHLSLTHPDFGKYAKNLFVTGVCEDLEILGSLSTAEKALTTKGHQNPEGWLIVYQGDHGHSWNRKNSANAAKAAKAWTEDEGTTDEESENAEHNASEADKKQQTPGRIDSFAVLDCLQELTEQAEQGAIKTHAEALRVIFNQLLQGFDFDNSISEEFENMLAAIEEHDNHQDQIQY